MISAFGVDHGEDMIAKVFNPLRAGGRAQIRWAREGKAEAKGFKQGQKLAAIRNSNNAGELNRYGANPNTLPSYVRSSQKSEAHLPFSRGSRKMQAQSRGIKAGVASRRVGP